MVELLKCTECRGMVSSSAKRCPHCEKNFRDAACAICKTPVVLHGCKQVVSLPRHEDWERDRIIFAGSRYNGYDHRRFYCDVCWQKLKEISTTSRPPDTIITCQLCKNEKVISFQNHNHLARINNNKHICSSCGHCNTISLVRQAVSSCHICNMYLNENLEIRVNAPLLSCQFIHHICYTYDVRSEVKSKEEARRESLIVSEKHDLESKEKTKIKEREERRARIYHYHVSWIMFLGGFIGFFSAGLIGVLLGPFIGQFLWWLISISID
jgi:hypothetical protein